MGNQPVLEYFGSRRIRAAAHGSAISKDRQTKKKHLEQHGGTPLKMLKKTGPGDWGGTPLARLQRHIANIVPETQRTKI
jgi:hypothetical protein